MKDLSYKTVEAFLVAAIPEFRGRYEEEVEKRSGHPGQYLVFAALNSMVVQALDFSGDPGFLTNTFDAFEKMALSGDREVVSLLQVGFVQTLVSYPRRLAKAWVLMGEETRKITRDTAKAWNREANLPPAARSSEKSKAQGT